MLEPDSERAMPQVGSLDWLDRRLAAGDWVILAGADPTLAGLGKIVDGDYEEKFSTLRLARVEFARGSWWFFPGELVRLEPDDEASLCSRALEQGLVAGENAGRLRAPVRAFIERAKFARSPGLLDLLWSFLSLVAHERRADTCGLAAFFDEGGRLVRSWPGKPCGPRTPARPVRSSPSQLP